VFQSRASRFSSKARLVVPPASARPKARERKLSL
jgi:hypothetical protein